MKHKNKIPFWVKTGHSRPMHRREFLAHGIIPFAAYAYFPAALKLLLESSSVLAEKNNCLDSNVASWVPFVHLNLSGGAAMASNFVPMNLAGEPLGSYSKMGLGDGNVPIEKEFGNATFAGLRNGVLISKMLEGIRATASRATLDKTAFLGLCVRSRDDSSENRFSISGLLNNAGMVGSRLPQLGIRNTLSGVNQLPTLKNPPAPLVVNNFNDIINSLGYSASLGSNLTTNQKISVSRLVASLNSAQTEKLYGSTVGVETKKLIDCVGLKNTNLLAQGGMILDPKQNPDIARVWNLQNSNNLASEDYVFGSMTYCALNSFSGAVSFEKGGFDYHDNTRSTGDTRDRQAGVVMGRVLESAAVLNKPVFLYVTSDGAVSSAESETDRSTPWVSDRGSAGASYIFIYDPTKRPELLSNQLGSFTSGQSADDQFLIGNSPDLAAQAVFANYLQFNKKINLFSNVVRGFGLDTADLNQVVKVV